MKPYYERDGIAIYHADCRDVLPTLEAGSVDAVVTDPPYFEVKNEEWDRQWAGEEEYLAWLSNLLAEWRRILKPNGSLYLFASPQMACKVELKAGEHFRVLNSIRWLKEDGWHKKTEKEALRSFLSPWEAIIFAEQYADAYGEAEQALHKEVYAPIGRYIQLERERAGLTRNEVEVALGYVSTSDPTRGTALCYRWEEGACLPTEETYGKLREVLNRLGRRDYEYLRRDYEYLRRDYEYLRRDYEDLRRDYEDLRRPFYKHPSRPDTDIWNYATVPAVPGKHPCEKPLALMEQIILTSTRPGDLVHDSCMGSGTTGVAAVKNGRRFVGMESEQRYCRQAKRRIEAETQQGNFLSLIADAPLLLPATTGGH